MSQFISTPLVLALLAMLSSPLLAQEPTRVSDQDKMLRTRKVNRVNLQEKTNAQIKNLPNILITAYRMGYIDGMFPNTHDGLMDRNRFMEVFEIPGHRLDLVGMEDACCKPSDLPQSNWRIGQQLDTDALKSIHYPGFNTIVEFIESETFDKNDSRNKWETHYIRLVWVDPQGQMGARNAILFKYEDVYSLLSQIKGFNPRNEAAALSYRQLIDLRKFSSYPVEVSGQVLMSMKAAKVRARNAVQRDEERMNNR